jgi:shikimate dehydrogenase
MPYKVAVLAHLDFVAPEVKAIGACNTVVNDNGRLCGYNTDWRGAIDALQEAGMEKPRAALVVGAGGAARAVAYGLMTLGSNVTIAARDRAAGDRLCRDLGLLACIDLTKQLEVECDLVVNATPVTSLEGSVVDLVALRRAQGLLDLVFSPRDTELAEFARGIGLRVAPGWRMLLHQAAHQFRHYTGKDAPLEAMEPVLRDALA